MKSTRCAVWLLSSLLVILSLDAAPDSAAVKPHAVSAEASSSRGGITRFCESHLRGALLSASSLVSVRFLTFTSDHEPVRSGEMVVLMGQAADPSPPSV